MFMRKGCGFEAGTGSAGRSSGFADPSHAAEFVGLVTPLVHSAGAGTVGTMPAIEVQSTEVHFAEIPRG